MSTPTFQPTTFVDLTREQIIAVLNGGNPPTGAHPLSAAEMNRLGIALQALSINVNDADTGFVERAQDAAAAMFRAGTNVTFTYDDTANTFTINATGGGGGTTDPEIVRDTIGGALVGGAGISILVNDAADTITIAVTGFATVATSGAYSDLTGKPSIPAIGAAGSGAGNALSANDPTTTNTRTPTAHAASHGTGGSDPITPASIGADPAGAATTAQANSVQRANHTGTQPATTVTGLAAVATSGAYTDLTGRPALAAVATSGSAADLTGLLPQASLPPLAINDTFVVASQAAMLALTAQRGDMAVRTDLTPTRMFVLTADAPATLANWTEITAAGSVLSVAGRQGAIVLAKGDVGLDQVSNLAPAALADLDDWALAYAPRVSLLGSTITTATTLTPNRHHPVDASAGPVTVTLPTPTRFGQRIRVEKVDSSVNLVSITGTIRGATTTGTLRDLSRTVEFFAESMTSWRPANSHHTDASLDLRYEKLVTRGAATAGQVPTLQADGTLAFAAAGGAAVGFLAGAFPVSTRWSCAQGPWSGDSSSALGDGVLRLASFALGRGTTFKALEFNVQSAGSTGSVTRIAIYSDSDGLPKNLMYASPAIDTTSTGDKFITGLSVVLPAGRYWVGLVSQGAPTTNPSMRIFSGETPAAFLMGGNAGDPNISRGNAGFQIPGITAAPPAVASGFTYIYGVMTIPQVWLQAQ